MPDIAALVNHAQRLREKRSNWMLHFEELARYFYPHRRGFITQFEPGSELQEEVWTSYPQIAARNLIEWLDARMRPRGSYFLALAPVRPELAEIPAVRIWCDFVSKKMTHIIYAPRARFAERMKELTADTVIFGTGIMFVNPDLRNRRLFFKVVHLKDVAWEQDISGQPTKVYYFLSLTLAQLVDEFGVENLPRELIDKWQQPSCNTDEEFEVLHCVMRSEEFERYGYRPFRLPLTSYWILTRTKHLLAQGGHRDMPYVIVRWDTVTGETMGRSPTMVALNDARTANTVAAALVEITEKQGNPPVQYPFDAIRGELELFAGGATPYDLQGYQYQGDPIRPVQMGSDAPLTAEFLQGLEMRIGQALFADVIAPLQTVDGNLRPLEQLQIQQMAMARAAPVFSAIQDEIHGPIFDRVFSILMSLNEFPPPPPVLLGQELEWRYDTPVSNMREQAEGMRTLEAIQMVGQFDPQGLSENLDRDLTVRRISRQLGVPEVLLKPMEQVIEERAERAQMQQAAAMAEIAKNAAPAVKAVADMSQGQAA